MKNFFKTLLVILVIACSLSCEIGLGESVDTEAPEITITSPETDVIIRDSFAIKGTWSDDGSISRVNVTLSRTDGNGEDLTYTASLTGSNGSGEWSALIEPTKEDYKIIDGSYEATVEIADAAGHTVRQTRTFVIDNTAPIIVLQRPGTKVDPNKPNVTPDAYGQTFSINGMGADDNSIDHIDINIYEDEACTNLIKTITKLNVAPTIELDVAVFEEGVDNDYSTIYGSNSKNENHGTQNRYCTITAYDKAKRYPVDGNTSDSDLKGNSTSVYYLYDDIYGDILDKYNLSVTDVYKLLNGTYQISTGSRSASSDNDNLQETVDTLLGGKETTISNFSLNPENNPVFIINAIEALPVGNVDFDSNNYNITNGNTIVAEVSVGLDGIPLKEDSLRPYLLPCNRYGVLSCEDTSSNRIYLTDKGSGSKSGTSYKFTVDLNCTLDYTDSDGTETAKNINVGNYYIFGFEGSDSKGNSIKAKNNRYGFKLESSGIPPELSTVFYQIGSGNLKAVTSVVYINGQSQITVYGNYSDGELGVNELSFDLGGVEINPSVTYATSEISDSASVTSAEFKAYSEIENKKDIRSWKIEYTPEASLVSTGNSGSGKKFAVKGTNLNQTEALIKPFSLLYDADVPSLSNITLTTNSTDYSVYRPDSDLEFYVNNTQGEFTLSGNSSDASGIASVKIDLYKNGNYPADENDTSKTPDQTETKYDAEAYIWSWSDINISSWGTSARAIITATDVAGNESHETVNIIFDAVSPTGEHKIDSNSKDLYFRVGDSDNDDITSSSTPAWTPSLDKDVGGKYSENTYGNASTITIRGKINENGSGLKMIYYYVFDKPIYIDDTIEESVTTPTNKTVGLVNYYAFRNNKKLRDYVIANKTGSFTPLSAVERKRVFYNVDGSDTFEGTQLAETTQYYKEVESNYKSTITGLNNAKNYLVIAAIDNVGNRCLDTVVTGSGDNKVTKNYYQINIDTVTPDIKLADTESSMRYSNANDDLSFSGSASDHESGLRSVTFSVNEKTITSTDSTYGSVNLDTTSGEWTLLLKKEALTSASGNISVYTTVTDNAGAGNSKTISLATIVMDKTYPSATINSVTDADSSTDDIDVNKKFTLSGLASDDMSLASVKLQYKKSSDSTWIDYPVAGKNAWSVTINTESLDDKTSYDFRAVATDLAGNTGNSGKATEDYSSLNVKTLYVNQDSDRPVIQFTNGQTLGSSTSPMTADNRAAISVSSLGGIVTDDDGVKKLEYKIDSIEADGSETEGDWTVANPSNPSSPSFTIPLTDGSKNISFRVTDSNDTVFTSSDSESVDLNSPKIKDGAESPVTYGYSSSAKKATLLYVRVDTKPPYAGSLKFAAGSTAISNDASWQDKTAISSSAFGGKSRRYMKIKIPVWDDNGITSVKMTGLNGEVSFSPTTENPGISSYPEAVYWISDQIDFKDLESGLKTCTITVSDGVSTSADEFSITVDNTAPTSITNVKPGKTEAVTGVVNFRGNVSDNEGGAGIKYIKDENENVTAYGVEYYIPKYSEMNTQPSLITSGWLEPTSKGTVSWEIEFQNLGTTIGYNSSTYAVSNDFKDYETVKATDTTEGSGLYDIPVWFRLTDAVGNVGYNKENSIRYNPNADRPTVQITYPSHESGKDYVTMGGTITISGMANDDDGISRVYLQFDMNGDGTFENGVGVTGSPFSDSDIVDIPNFTGQRGILASGTKSWYKTLNISNLNGVNYTSNTKTLNIRALAIESDSEKLESQYLRSSWSDILHVSVNNTIPQFSGVKLKKYDTELTESTLSNETATAEQEYTSDMYINGNERGWYLCGQVQSATQELDTVTVSGSTTSIIEVRSNQNKTSAFAIPVSLSSGTKWNIEVLAIDKTSGSPQQNKYKADINIDSQAPAFTDTKTVGSNTEIKLYKSQYGVSANELSSSTYVQNSNGWFTLTGRVTEELSGYNKVVFYFKRNGSGSDNTNRVYNPMEEHGQNNMANRTNISAAPASGAAKTSGNLYINDDDLPALYISGATRSGENSITSSSIMNNKNIRRGGLIKIGGTYRLITDVSDRDNSGTISFTPNCSTTYTEAEFVYGMVVDHTGESQNSDGSVKNDDDYADGMVESYTKSGSTYTWDATINSKNIPDGPIEIHCVAFDNAGNASHGYTTTKVSNNPPRITSVKLGTDLNADGKYALDNEFTTFYYAKTASGAGDTSLGTDVWNLDAKVDSQTWWKAKKDLVVIPEFVGGSGSIYYNYSKSTGENAAGLEEAAGGSISASPATLAVLSSSNTSIVTSAGESGTTATLSASQTENKIGALILKNDASTDGLGKINSTAGEDSVNIYRFSFWDSTEGCTVGSDSQWSVLNAKFSQDLADNVKPEGSIKPFYWESASKNSVVWNSSVAQGHIELEGDLPATFTATGSGVNDRDPKVSGKIKIEGTAFDETRLGSIKLTFANKTATASYSSASGWSGGTTDADFSLTVTDENGLTQNGHSVTWTLIVDTSKVVTDAVAALNKAISVSVSDAASNVSAASEEQTTAEENTPYYKVDIVPYITKISTRLDDAYSANTSVFNRSANGSYPVIRGEEGFKLYGFNLNGASTSVKFNGTSVGTVTAGSTSDYITFTVPTTATSGAIDITVSEIASLNNVNSTSAEYNLEPNGINNNTLTDDRSVYVWGMNNVLSGTVTTIRYPSFRIGKDANQTVGFVYDNDGRTVRYNLGGDDNLLDTSFSQWYATACAVDSSGHIYASAQNGDSGGQNYGNLNDSSYANYKFYAFADRIDGTNYTSVGGAYSQGGNNVALENCQDDSDTFYAERVKNPKIATSGSSTTKMYTVYYDSSVPKIVFRYGEATYSRRNQTITFDSEYGIYERSDLSAANAQTIDNSSDVGEYAAVGVIPTGVTGAGTAVVCWNSGNALKFKYNTNPARTTWSDTITIDSDYAGEYCDLAVDAAGGIHIAYYRAGNKLKYAYLESYLDTNPVVCMVDSYLSVGENISIETSSKTISYTETVNGTETTKKRYVPYISYYSSAIGLAKVAWPVKLGTNGSKANTFVNGVSSDMFTGYWEVQALPTALSTKLLNYTIGVGEKTNGTANSVMLGYGTKTGLQTALLY